jgi:hypothetical protein
MRYGDVRRHKLRPQRLYFLILVSCAIMLFFTACNSHGASPVDQGLPGSDLQQRLSVNADLPSGESVFGAFDFILNPETLSVETLPLRAVSEIGDSWDLDISQYLSSHPCSNCLKVSGIGADEDGNVILDIGIKHPFPSGGQRIDLDVFDVRAILVVQGDEQFEQMQLNDEPMCGNFHFLSNANGFTNHFDDGPEGPYPGNLNPYIDFFTEDNPAWDLTGEEIQNHKMAMGADYDYKRLKLDIPPGASYPFRIVIGASYGQSSKKSIPQGDLGSRTNPLYYLPEFNRKEACVVNLKQSIDYGVDPYLVIDLEVVDWQAGAHVATVYPENTGEITAPSGIETAAIEIPQLDFFSEQPDSITGEGLHEMPYHVKFNVPLSSFSVYTCLAKVTDERNSVVEDMDMSTYQYGKIDTFIRIGDNIPLTEIHSSAHEVVLGRKSIAVDGHRVYVVWSDVVDMRGVVCCAKSNDGGQTFGSPIQVNDANHEDIKQKPAIAVDSEGTIYVVWEDYGNLNPFSDAPDILMAKSNNNAYSFGQNVMVNDEEDVADDFQTEPIVCTSANDHVFVCWMERLSGSTAKHIRMARSSNGGTSFAETQVSSEQLRTGSPTMDANDDGTIWIAWRDYRCDNQDIFAARSSNNGQTFSQEIKVNDDSGYAFQSEPSLGVDDDGKCYIAWLDRRNGRFDIFFARSEGVSAFSTNKMINRIPGTAINPIVAVTGDGGVFVVHKDTRSDALGDIFVTASLDAGTTFTDQHDVKINDDQGMAIQLSPQIALGQDGKLHFVWGDGRGNNPRVFYAQSIFP